MITCEICFTYGVQTVATKINGDEVEVCFECIGGGK